MLKPELPENKFGQKTLRLVLKELIKEIPLEDFSDPYYSNAYREIKEVLKKFGILDISHEDFGFWAKLVTENHNKNQNEPLVIPKASKYQVITSEERRKYVNEFYSNTIISYDRDFIESQLNNDGEFYPSGGDLIDEDYYDSDSDGWTIDEIKKLDINESKKRKTPLLENRELRNKEIIQLQKMKMLIEERLKILSF